MKYLQSTLLAATLCCSFAHADEVAELPAPATTNIFATLTERGFASSLLAKNLTKEWRVLRVANAPEQTALLLMMMGAGRGDSSPWSDMFYTRGDLVSFADQNYLVAYRVLPPSDPKERRRQQQYLEAWQNENNQDDEYAFATALPPIDENSQLALSLLAIGKTTNLNDIRSFDPAKDLMTEKYKATRKTVIERAASQTNLKNVALAAKQYIQDFDEVYPVMRAARSAAEVRSSTDENAPNAPVQAALLPYIKNAELFLHPGTGRPYLPNYKISRKNESAIENSSETFLFFEDAPDAAGMRNVAFVDGHVKAFKEADFQRLRKAQGISESGLPSALPAGFKPKKPGVGSRRGRGIGSASGVSGMPTNSGAPARPATRPTPSPR